MEKKLPQRKQNRLANFDYSTEGAYFITICTHHRRKILSRIVGGDVPDAPQKIELYPGGKIADKYIKQLSDFYDGVCVEKYVIMPNHIHLILSVFENGTSRTSSPTRQHSAVSRFVSTLKRFCNKECGFPIWQRSFHDHVIRDGKDYNEIAAYIEGNPLNWENDCFFNEGDDDRENCIEKFAAK